MSKPLTNRISCLILVILLAWASSAGAESRDLPSGGSVTYVTAPPPGESFVHHVEVPVLYGPPPPMTPKKPAVGMDIDVNSEYNFGDVLSIKVRGNKTGMETVFFKKIQF